MARSRRHLRSVPGQPGIIREAFSAISRCFLGRPDSATPTSAPSDETPGSRRAIEQHQPQSQLSLSPAIEATHVALDEMPTAVYSDETAVNAVPIAAVERSPPQSEISLSPTISAIHIALDANATAQPDAAKKTSAEDDRTSPGENKTRPAARPTTPNKPPSTGATTSPDMPPRGGPSDPLRTPRAESPNTETNPSSTLIGGPLTNGVDGVLSQYMNPQAKTLWDRALMGLLESDREGLTPSESLSGILSRLSAQATAAHKECIQKKLTFTWNGEKVFLYDVASRVTGWIGRFISIGDVVVSFDPTHAALPWAAFRFVLQLAVQDQQQLGDILIGLDRIGSLINRCTAIEMLYLKDNPAAGDAAQNLEKSLLALYTALLNYLAYAKTLCQQRSFRRAVKGIFDPEALTTFLDAIITAENSVDSDSSLAEAEYNRFAHRDLSSDIEAMRQTLTNFVDDVRTLQHLNGTLSNIFSALDATERANILAWISPISYAEHHTRARDRRTPGTGEWILSRREFAQWIDSNSTKLLWLRGIRE